MSKLKPNLLKPQVGDVIERKTGSDTRGTWNEEDGEYGKWAEVTVIKKIVDNDKEDAIYYETARRYIETGITKVRRNQTKQAKYLCVNGPLKGQYKTGYGKGSDEDYIVYNCGTRQGRRKADNPPSAVLVYGPDIIKY